MTYDEYTTHKASQIYRTQHHISLEFLHVSLFAASFLIHLVLLAIHKPSADILAIPHTHFSFPLLLQCMSQASTDLIGLGVIYCECVLRLLPVLCLTSFVQCSYGRAYRWRSHLSWNGDSLSHH